MKKITGLLVLYATSVFGVAQFSGNACTTTAVTDGTKQTLINNIETAALACGWTTVSGHATTTLIMLSGTTPQSLQIRMRIKDNGGTNIQVYMENSTSTLAPASYATTNGGTLAVVNGLTYNVIGSHYQLLIYTANATTSRQFVWIGMPFLNTQLAANITVAGFLFADSNSDSQATSTGSIRNCVMVAARFTPCAATQTSNYELMINTSWWEVANTNNVTPFDVIGAPRFILDGVTSEPNQTLSSATAYRWRTSSPAIVTGDVFLAWGLTGTGVESLINGQVWDCVYINSSQPINTTSTFNGHNWINLTNSNAGVGLNSSQVVPGGLWFATN